MPLRMYSLRVDFSRLRRASTGLSYPRRLRNSLLGLCLGAQTCSPSRYCRPPQNMADSIVMPANTKAAVLKIDIRSHMRRGIQTVPMLRVSE